MEEIGLDPREVHTWYVVSDEGAYRLVLFDEALLTRLPGALVQPVRRSYIDDAAFAARIAEIALEDGTDSSAAGRKLLAAILPPPGAVRAGDFGEILAYLIQGTITSLDGVFGPKKLRLKEDRTRAALRSDVVHFILPRWPSASESDEIHCAEVKVKTTKNKRYDPIASALEGAQADRDGRLTKTLLWLRDQAIRRPLGRVTKAHIERFLFAVEHPQAREVYRAIVILCSSLWEHEKARVPPTAPTHCDLLIVTLPNAHKAYNDLFDATLEATG